MRQNEKGKNRFFIFQAFVIVVVLFVVIGLRGIIYEEELARAQYIPGFSVIGITKKVSVKVTTP